MKRILVTGSRDWEDYESMIRALNEWYRKFKDDGPVILVSGHAVGADQMAESIWAEKVNKDWIELHPAADYGHPLKRNDAMLLLGADIVLGFACPCVKFDCKIDKFHYSHGTSYTLQNAEAAGMEFRLIFDLTKPPF